MSNNKNLEPFNKKGERHGYWEIYRYNGTMRYKGNYVNSQLHGYFEDYYSNGQLANKGNFVNSEYHGLWEFYLYDGLLDDKCHYDNGKRVDYEVLIESVTSEMFPIY